MKEQEEIIKKEYKINLLKCIIYAIIVLIYFIFLNVISTLQNFNLYVKISYIMLILISIIMFEIAYKKGKKHLIVSGIEIILLAVHTLLIERSQVSIISTSYIWPTYYCLKAVIIYTQENRRKLKQISDIAEIVKEEKPLKKVAKKRKK